jgi:hypothetical protein
MLITND